MCKLTSFEKKADRCEFCYSIFRPLSPSRLPLRAHFHQKRDVWVRGSTRPEIKSWPDIKFCAHAHCVLPRCFCSGAWDQIKYNSSTAGWGLTRRCPCCRGAKQYLSVNKQVKYLYFAHQMCPLSIVDLWFFRNVLLRSIGQFSLNSFTRFHFPALPSCGIWRTCVRT